jgi:cytochrome b
VAKKLISKNADVIGSAKIVWDAPTRIFHWLLVVLVGLSWWSAKNDHLEWHRYSGITVLALLVFRVLWGLFGTSTARFTQFVKGPRVVWAYVRGERTPDPLRLGHSPLGGWSVIGLLASVFLQMASGLFAIDIDGIESGPLSPFVTFNGGRFAAAMHKFSFNLLLALMALHLGAVLFYAVFRRRNLISAMITGSRVAERGSVPASVASGWRLIVAVLVSACLAYGVAKGFRFS